MDAKEEQEKILKKLKGRSFKVTPNKVTGGSTQVVLRNLATKSGKMTQNSKKPKKPSKRKPMSDAAKKRRAKARRLAKEAEKAKTSVAAAAKKPEDDDEAESEDETLSEEDEDNKMDVPLSNLKDPKKFETTTTATAEDSETKNPVSKVPPTISLLHPFKSKNKKGEAMETPLVNVTASSSLPGDETLEVTGGDGADLSTPNLFPQTRSGEAEPTSHESKDSVNSMSFAKVNASTPASETSVEVIDSLRNAFSDNVEELEALAKEVLPDINSLPPQAINFFLSIFGFGDILPATNVVEDLVSFVAICTSLKFAAIAQHKMRKDKSYQFRLRYFAGVGNQDNDKLTDRNNPDLEVVEFIRRFFTSIFNNPENKHIDDCVRRARSLFITAKTLTTARRPSVGKDADTKEGDQSGNKQGAATIDAQEEIIACINFALLDGHGFWVNWLATTNEKLSPKKYGEDLKLVCGNGNFQNRHLALFLMKAANFAVVTHLRLKSQLSPDYMIVLQARVSPTEKAAKFYTKVGFEEVGPLDDDKTLSKEIFESFPKMLEKSKESSSDFMHFIWDAEDICVFKNNSGSFAKIRSFSRRYSKIENKDVVFTSKAKEFSFPFEFQQRNLWLLACNLDLFFLPFQNGKLKEEDYIEPNSVYTSKMVTLITESERRRVKAKDGWLNDQCIDFYIRW